jgi:hypothetical protein
MQGGPAPYGVLFSVKEVGAEEDSLTHFTHANFKLSREVISSEVFEVV